MTGQDGVLGTGLVRAEYWRELVAAWRASGQTAVAFCRPRQINPGTFAWWRRELARRDGLGSGQSRGTGRPPSFVEVTVGSGRRGSGYELTLANGRRIGVPADFEDGVLRRLIAVAEAGC
jgi:hypothetical protein